ncbi:MAG TPA: hypothetical protein VKT74_08300 [Gammaproteobacteria bacterium]|nr:hypothetical protein [Gammaproteobacteria bacterium]
MKKALPYMDIEQPDDFWMIQKIEENSADFHNLRTMQVAIISYDQIIEYMHDPQTTRRQADGFEYGFVRLKVQIFIHGLDITSEPIDAQTRQRIEEELLSLLSK